jgi:hypothetical protein
MAGARRRLNGWRAPVARTHFMDAALCKFRLAIAIILNKNSAYRSDRHFSALFCFFILRYFPKQDCGVIPPSMQNADNIYIFGCVAYMAHSLIPNARSSSPARFFLPRTDKICYNGLKCRIGK